MSLARFELCAGDAQSFEPVSCGVDRQSRWEPGEARFQGRAERVSGSKNRTKAFQRGRALYVVCAAHESSETESEKEVFDLFHSDVRTPELNRSTTFLSARAGLSGLIF